MKEAGKQARARAEWLLFVLTLQGGQKTARMRIWRALKNLGAGVLRDGVYLLPNRQDLRARIDALDGEIAGHGGSTQIFEVDARDSEQQNVFTKLFDRTPEYQALLREIAKAGSGLKRERAAAPSLRIARLQRSFTSIYMQDYFPAEAAKQVRIALDALSDQVMRAVSPDEPHAKAGKVKRADDAKYRKRVWATRQRPWADRLASAWLIRRFIDSEATFVWLAKPEDCPKRAVGFDFDGATFTHLDGKVTFEVLVESFGLDGDAGLQGVGALIHYLDVGGIPVPEAAGFESLLRAAREAHTSDDRLLAATFPLFELLYVSYARPDAEREA